MDVIKILIPFVEIGILTFVFHYLLSFFWNTRAMDLVIGFLFFLFLFSLVSWLHLPVLQQIMLTVINVVVIAILIIFQPELRIALSKISIKGRKSRKITEFDKFLDLLAASVYKLADKRIGAIILL